MVGGNLKHVAVDPEDGGIERVTESGGVLGQNVHHRLQIGRRTRNHAQDLTRRGLLLKRLAQGACEVLDCPLQVRV
jgi:hypothetical protein